jgi:hypothetical protein
MWPLFWFPLYVSRCSKKCLLNLYTSWCEDLMVFVLCNSHYTGTWLQFWGSQRKEELLTAKCVMYVWIVYHYTKCVMYVWIVCNLLLTMCCMSYQVTMTTFLFETRTKIPSNASFVLWAQIWRERRDLVDGIHSFICHSCKFSYFNAILFFCNIKWVF